MGKNKITQNNKYIFEFFIYFYFYLSSVINKSIVYVYLS